MKGCMDTKVFSKRGEATISTITAFIVSCLIYQGFSSMKNVKPTASVRPASIETLTNISKVNN